MATTNIKASEGHQFHIPVMGLGFTIDTAVKVGRFGISSVLSVMEDHLIEKMRAYHSLHRGYEYVPIGADEHDSRARRITAYLNLLNKILNEQVLAMKSQSFEENSDLVKYFELLPEHSDLKKSYMLLRDIHDRDAKEMLENYLREHIRIGDIDVNIMTKLDKINYAKDGTILGPEYADAMSALRGFALSELHSSIVFSAGLNPRLYSYCEQFQDFFPDKDSSLKKRIILKVSDFRSARIQGSFFAKKGLWISEFRIESGLNCGGHAFATDGYLLGPILQEFYDNREALSIELYALCQQALQVKNKNQFKSKPILRISAQGGVGTNEENNFLLHHYQLDSVGWGSPFLLVPEACNVDDDTLDRLLKAGPDDYFLSNASPLGVPFNNLRTSSSEDQRKTRIEKGRSGSPCYKKFLAFNTEFGEAPICTASRKYQHLKMQAINANGTSKEEQLQEIELMEEKDCLCEGLGASAVLKNNIAPEHKLKAVVICPGPNLAYFTGIFSLSEMCSHIYGRLSLLNSVPRKHMFLNELVIYINYLESQIEKNRNAMSDKLMKGFESYREKLLDGIEYYNELIRKYNPVVDSMKDRMRNDLYLAKMKLLGISIPGQMQQKTI